MSNKLNYDVIGLNDLLELFEGNVEISDITASKILGSISASIIKRRMELSMTQKEFAAYMGVSQGMISRWEGGDYNFSIKALADIADKLDMELTVKMDEHRRGFQAKDIQNTDISYVVSEQKKFIGKTSKVSDYKQTISKVNIMKNEGYCKFYSFEERLEM